MERERIGPRVYTRRRRFNGDSKYGYAAVLGRIGKKKSETKGDRGALLICVFNLGLLFHRGQEFLERGLESQKEEGPE